MYSPLKGFLLLVSLKATKDKWRIRFWFLALGRNLSPRNVAHRGDYLCCGLHTAEIISAVCCTLPRLTPGCVAHRRDCLRGVLHTAEIFLKLGTLDSSVCCTCTPLISSLWCDVHRGYDLCSTVCCTPWRQLCDRISLQNRSRIRKYSSPFIGGPDGFENWKSKISGHTSF